MTRVGGGHASFDKGKQKEGTTPAPHANPADPPMTVLWDSGDKVELVEGSNCVVIGGKKYWF